MPKITRSAYIHFYERPGPKTTHLTVAHNASFGKVDFVIPITQLSPSRTSATSSVVQRLSDSSCASNHKISR
jgi:hypothetical protein